MARAYSQDLRDRVLCSQTALKFFMQFQRSIHETRSGDARTITIQRIRRSGLHAWVDCQTEIVV